MSLVISVLVPVRGESADLLECLDSLDHQTLAPGRFEVLVADGSDRPIDASALGARPYALTVVPNPERIMTAGLNLLAARARGGRLAILSAHSSVPPDYLASVLAIAEKTGAANVGGRVVKVAKSPWGRAVAAATSSPLAVGNAAQHYGGSAGLADSVFPGFIDRVAFERIGGFDVRLRCNEDDELNARLRWNGETVWYDPSIEVTYHPRETVGGLWQQQYRYGRWKVAVARTGIPGYLRWRHLVPSVAVAGSALTALLVFARSRLAFPGLAAIVLYLGLAGIEGRRTSRGHGASPLRTSILFPVVHTAYGIGFIRGLLDRGMPKEK